MNKKQLSPAQQFELRYLKQQESKWSEERFKYNKDPNTQAKYYRAKEDLSNFVSKLRLQGVYI